MARLVLAASLALILVAAQALGQDELKFNGNNGDNQVVPNREDLRPAGPVAPALDGQIYDNPGDKTAPRPPPASPIELLFPGLGDSDAFNQNGGFGGLFGGGQGQGSGLELFGTRPRPHSLFHQLLGGGIFDSLHRHHHNFERQFRDLERQAAEGQDISYFNRNGVEYVRTCTTKRLSRGGQQQQQQQQQESPLTQPLQQPERQNSVSPVNQPEVRPQPQPQPQSQQQQNESNEIPSPPSPPQPAV